MHVKDYCALIFVLGMLIALVGAWAAQKRFAWWKDALQIAGVMLVVSMVLGALTPSKPKDLIAEARQEAEAIQASDEKMRSRQIVEAMTACEYAIQAQLQYPGSYSNTFLSSANKQFETAQGWEIYKAFEAKNGFGGSLPHVGHCSITRSGSISVSINRS